MKKGMLRYAEEGGIADDSGKEKSEAKKSDEVMSAGEMHEIVLFEKAFEPSFGDGETAMERKHHQIKAFKELLAYCLKR